MRRAKALPLFSARLMLYAGFATALTLACAPCTGHAQAPEEKKVMTTPPDNTPSAEIPAPLEKPDGTASVVTTTPEKKMMTTTPDNKVPSPKATAAANAEKEPARDEKGNVIHPAAVAEGEATKGKPTEVEPQAGAPTVARDITKRADTKTKANKPEEVEPAAGAVRTGEASIEAQRSAQP